MSTAIRSRLQKKLAEKQAEKHKILQLSKLSQPSLEISMLKIGEEISIIFDSKSDIIKYIILNRDGIALNIPIPDDLKGLQRKYIEFISTTEIGTIIAIKTINLFSNKYSDIDPEQVSFILFERVNELDNFDIRIVDNLLYESSIIKMNEILDIVFSNINNFWIIIKKNNVLHLLYYYNLDITKTNLFEYEYNDKIINSLNNIDLIDYTFICTMYSIYDITPSMIYIIVFDANKKVLILHYTIEMYEFNTEIKPVLKPLITLYSIDNRLSEIGKYNSFCANYNISMFCIVFELPNGDKIFYTGIIALTKSDDKNKVTITLHLSQNEDFPQKIKDIDAQLMIYTIMKKTEASIKIEEYELKKSKLKAIKEQQAIEITNKLLKEEEEQNKKKQEVQKQKEARIRAKELQKLKEEEKEALIQKQKQEAEAKEAEAKEAEALMQKQKQEAEARAKEARAKEALMQKQQQKEALMQKKEAEAKEAKSLMQKQKQEEDEAKSLIQKQKQEEEEARIRAKEAEAKEAEVRAKEARIRTKEAEAQVETEVETQANINPENARLVNQFALFIEYVRKINPNIAEDLQNAKSSEELHNILYINQHCIMYALDKLIIKHERIEFIKAKINAVKLDKKFAIRGIYGSILPILYSIILNELGFLFNAFRIPIPLDKLKDYDTFALNLLSDLPDPNFSDYCIESTPSLIGYDDNNNPITMTKIRTSMIENLYSGIWDLNHTSAFIMFEKDKEPNIIRHPEFTEFIFGVQPIKILFWRNESNLYNPMATLNRLEKAITKWYM